MSGKAILVVGARGMGKTTTNKRLISNTHPKARLILDINSEYTGLYTHAPIHKFSEFTKKALTVKDCVILIEESTIYLKTQGQNDDITELLVRARHQNNTVIMSFHSLQRVPKYVFELCNVVVLHKTGDQLSDVKAFGDRKILEAFIEIEKAPMLKNKDTGKEYSPQKVINLY